VDGDHTHLHQLLDELQATWPHYSTCYKVPVNYGLTQALKQHAHDLQQQQQQQKRLQAEYT
jgi:hypothetical protein